MGKEPKTISLKESELKTKNHTGQNKRKNKSKMGTRGQ